MERFGEGATMKPGRHWLVLWGAQDLRSDRCKDKLIHLQMLQLQGQSGQKVWRGFWDKRTFETNNQALAEVAIVLQEQTYFNGYLFYLRYAANTSEEWLTILLWNICARNIP